MIPDLPNTWFCLSVSWYVWYSPTLFCFSGMIWVSCPNTVKHSGMFMKVHVYVPTCFKSRHDGFFFPFFLCRPLKSTDLSSSQRSPSYRKNLIAPKPNDVIRRFSQGGAISIHLAVGGFSLSEKICMRQIGHLPPKIRGEKRNGNIFETTSYLIQVNFRK